MQDDSCCMTGVFLLWEGFPVVLSLFFSAFRTLCLQLLRSLSLSLRVGGIGKTLFFFFLLLSFFLACGMCKSQVSKTFLLSQLPSDIRPLETLQCLVPRSSTGSGVCGGGPALCLGSQRSPC